MVSGLQNIELPIGNFPPSVTFHTQGGDNLEHGVGQTGQKLVIRGGVEVVLEAGDELRQVTAAVRAEKPVVAPVQAS